VRDYAGAIREIICLLLPPPLFPPADLRPI